MTHRSGTPVCRLSPKPRPCLGFDAAGEEVEAAADRNRDSGLIRPRERSIYSSCFGAGSATKTSLVLRSNALQRLLWSSEAPSA